jgi:hypothetical protein
MLFIRIPRPDSGLLAPFYSVSWRLLYCGIIANNLSRPWVIGLGLILEGRMADCVIKNLHYYQEELKKKIIRLENIIEAYKKLCMAYRLGNQRMADLALAVLEELGEKK